jgi:DNA helicase-2/ATP-dependent DNA helicase PcrA
LTSRVAHLILHHRVPPNKLLVNTFTNKAAQEMKHRLRDTLGEEMASKIIMGTFHAACVRCECRC